MRKLTARDANLLGIVKKGDKMAGKKQAEFLQWFNPTLDALRELGGSGSPMDVSTTVAKNFNIPESKLN